MIMKKLKVNWDYGEFLCVNNKRWEKKNHAIPTMPCPFQLSSHWENPDRLFHWGRKIEFVFHHSKWFRHFTLAVTLKRISLLCVDFPTHAGRKALREQSLSVTSVTAIVLSEGAYGLSRVARFELRVITGCNWQPAAALKHPLLNWSVLQSTFISI